MLISILIESIGFFKINNLLENKTLPVFSIDFTSDVCDIKISPNSSDILFIAANNIVYKYLIKESSADKIFELLCEERVIGVYPDLEIVLSSNGNLFSMNENSTLSKLDIICLPPNIYIKRVLKLNGALFLVVDDSNIIYLCEKTRFVTKISNENISKSTKSSNLFSLLSFSP